MVERTVVERTVVEKTVVERTVVETTSGGKHLSLQEDPIVSRQKLLVTGLNDTPIQIHNGPVTELILLKTSHEEADVIMINQLLWDLGCHNQQHKEISESYM